MCKWEVDEEDDREAVLRVRRRSEGLVVVEREAEIMTAARVSVLHGARICWNIFRRVNISDEAVAI